MKSWLRGDTGKMVELRSRRLTGIQRLSNPGFGILTVSHLHEVGLLLHPGVKGAGGSPCVRHLAHQSCQQTPLARQEELLEVLRRSVLMIIRGLGGEGVRV